MHLRLGLVASLLLGCDSSPPAAAPAPASDAGRGIAKAEPATATNDGKRGEEKAARSKTPAKPSPTPLATAARAEYAKHLEEGRKLAKAEEWAKAIAELEAALAVIPGDDRALGELSWAAFSSGDHAKARTSAKAAVLAATNPKIKGAALYNLGRAEEALGELTAAKTAYEQSVALRPNEVVQKRLAELGKRVPEVVDPLPCTKPIESAKVCECLLATQPPEDVDGMPPECALKPTGVEWFSFARYSMSGYGEENVMLVARGPEGWSVVAQLDYVYNPGAFGIWEEWELAGAKERTIGGHTIVELTSPKSRSDSDMGVDEMETEATDTLVVCVRGDTTTAPRCPLRVMTSYDYQRDVMGLAEDGDVVKELQTPGLPISRSTKIAVTIGEDGIAKLRAEAGSVDPEQLGDRKLW
jgi:tetratricopeptide (TPR) repeat protein